METPKTIVTRLDDLDFSKAYTYYDYLTWQFDEMVELIKGKIFPMSPVPSTNHQQIILNLSLLFGNYLKGKFCKVFPAPFDVRLSVNGKENTVVQPDLCVVCDLEKLDAKGCKGAPDLIIEIVSKNNVRHDTHRKLKLYEEAGVKEYWIVLPSDQTVLVCLLGDEGKYEISRPYTIGDIVQTSTFPELSVDLKEAFDVLEF